MNSKSGKTIHAPIVWGALGICLILAAGVSKVSASEPSNANLTQANAQGQNARYLGELFRANLHSAKESSYRLIAQGLRYATTKLCENELVTELNDLNAAIASTLFEIDQAQSAFGKAQKSSLQHLNAAPLNRSSSPAHAIMESKLATEQLAKMTNKNRVVQKRLNRVFGQLVKGEILYQRIAAECLLDDFKSIFGPGMSPKPIPEIPDDTPPDEFLEGDGGLDPEIDLLGFEID